MKKIVFCFAIVALLPLSALAAETSQTMDRSIKALTGHWDGNITHNIRGKTAAKLTAGDKSTKVMFHLTPAGNQLTGASTMGTNSDKWTVDEKTFVQNDGKTTLTAERRPFEKLEPWVREKAGISPNDVIFAYHYKSCIINATGKPCTIATKGGEKATLPGGIDKAVWLFNVTSSKTGKTVDFGVYYTMLDKTQRILREKLTTKK